MCCHHYHCSENYNLNNNLWFINYAYFLELQNYALLLDANGNYHSTFFFDTKSGNLFNQENSLFKKSEEIHGNFDGASQVCFFDEVIEIFCIDVPLGMLFVAAISFCR